MDWDKLRIFHAVAESGSLTSAGRTLSLSQSAVSRQITTLEESLSVSLFRRHARGLVLTEQGLILHEATKDIFMRLSLIKGQLMDTRRLPEGPLTVTVSEFIATTWLAPRLGEFREQYPKIQLTIIIDDKVLNLNRREADAAIRLYAPKETGLVQRHLASIGFHLCASRKYLEKHGHPKTVNDLANHSLLVFPEGFAGPFAQTNWLLDLANMNTRDNFNVTCINSMYALLKAAQDGAGIAVMPDYLISASPELEVVLPTTQRPDVDMYFIYAEERRNSRRINALRDFILENVARTPFEIAKNA
jgi:DNA-binding transcriptional LysR family regulator